MADYEMELSPDPTFDEAFWELFRESRKAWSEEAKVAAYAYIDGMMELYGVPGTAKA